jgi:hypothetical protein
VGACAHPAAQAKGYAQAQMRPAKDRGESAMMPSAFDIDAAMIADYVLHAADEGRRLDRRIAAGHRVSACNQMISEGMDDAMCDEFSIGAIKGDVTRSQIREFTPPHGDYISRPHCGQHT